MNERPLPGPTLSPSDLEQVAPGAPARIGGRVMGDAGGGAFWLGDAFAAVRVALAPGGAPAHGDLVVVEGRRAAGEVTDARVVWRDTPQNPPRVDLLRGEPSPGDAPLGEADRLIAHGVGPRLVARAVALGAVRAFFERERFVEVETPSLVPSPGLDLHLDAFEVPGALFGGCKGYLATSPEYQMKRLLAGGMPRIFQTARAFRRGESGARHGAEFSLVEWYRSFAGMDDVVRDTEALVGAVARALLGEARIESGGRSIDLEPPFERLAVGEAFLRHAGVPPDEALRLADEDEERFFRLLAFEVEPGLARSGTPVFLIDFPLSQASLARRRPDDPRVCERFELYVAGVELCNGFGELVDPEEQRRRLLRDQARRARLGKPVHPLDERFLSALAEGVPPSAGNALGLDRLVALCLDAPAIDLVQAFPRAWL